MSERALLSSDTLEGHWRNLASEDARESCRSVWAMVAAPEQSTKRVDEYLHSLPVVDPIRVKSLLADLNAQKFSVRDAACRELASLGERVKPALMEALRGRLETDARKHIQEMLDKINDPLNPERLRWIRVLEMLEHIGTASAIRVMERVSKGALGESAVRDADASLRRLSILQQRD